MMLDIRLKVLLMALAIGSNSCEAQKKKNMQGENSNAMLCDTVTGMCEMPGSKAAATGKNIAVGNKPVRMIYFTDPICSSCWGIEPQLRKLKLEYGDQVEIEYRMGGLLPDWSYNSGGISKPADVAGHWDEVSHYYKMPIDGDVWLEDPLASSYPSSIAFKAAQLQDADKALRFLRIMREFVFLRKKNIAKWEHMAAAAGQAGLDTMQLKQDYETKGKALFEQDLAMARQMGVRGFPTIFITNGSGQTETVYGSKPYAAYEGGIKKVYAQVEKSAYPHDKAYLFEHYATLTTREFAELSEITMPQAETALQTLEREGYVSVLRTKNGPLWLKK